MGNLQKWAGPLPDHWIQSQLVLGAACIKFEEMDWLKFVDQALHFGGTSHDLCELLSMSQSKPTHQIVC